MSLEDGQAMARKWSMMVWTVTFRSPLSGTPLSRWAVRPSLRRKAPMSIYDFQARDLNGEEKPLSDY
ncbi:MAG TPA: hypothetical protein DEB61_04385, partial [Alcanivorax sp.]|nr:hypothetical protein [Alcanivorax sp.]